MGGRRDPGEGPRTLAPLLRERWQHAGQMLWHGTGFGRALLLRRVVAALLVALAAVLAFLPATGASAPVPVLVATRDMGPGAVLGSGDVAARELPATLVPDGAARAMDQTMGRTLAAPVRRGEPLTDVRLVGAGLARAVSADPGAVSVPLRLPDADVAALLHPGAVVDVVSVGERQSQPVVLARRARVLAVLDPDTRSGVGARPAEGRLVLVALDAAAATRVAAASLSQALTVTVR